MVIGKHLEKCTKVNKVLTSFESEEQFLCFCCYDCSSEKQHQQERRRFALQKTKFFGELVEHDTLVEVSSENNIFFEDAETAFWVQLVPHLGLWI